MWRGYADRGGGYCLGFNHSGLDRFILKYAEAGENMPQLLKLYYGEMFPPSIISCLQSLGTLLNLRPTGETVLPLLTFAVILGDMMKHESFSEEQEWRLVVSTPRVERMQFRAGYANIKPYIELYPTTEKRQITKRLPLEEVIYGPTLRTEDGLEESIKWMLEKCGYKDVAVRQCLIPYRL